MRSLSVASIRWALGGVALSALIVAACVHDRDGKVASAAGASEQAIPDRPDYNWDVRPILSQNCFVCHGKSTQKAGLRLDLEKAAYGDIPEDKGKHAIVPGNPAKSELYKRLITSDGDYVMPPKDGHKSLTPREIAIIQRWIKQGAKYEQHWAYIAPKVVEPQKSSWDKQAVNPIDQYVYANLAKQGLSPSPEADRETLINRVYLDLTGLPPTLAEVDAFVASKDPNAYEHLVDKLLASHQYAERQATIWLDVARYADSDGYLNDGGGRFQHPYRDWVISAFERNIPYDRFVTWQLAGDLMPNPTREQVLATAFVRAGKKSNEGGIIDEEYRVEYVNERTELMGKAFLGLTVACGKCHDHKYDVISQADYYSMGGFFNSIDERGIESQGGRATPMGPTQAWPTAMEAANLAAAHKVTEAKEAGYQAALAAARRAAAPRIDAVLRAPEQRTAFVKAAVDSDLQAYYPMESGYKASFASLMVGPSNTRFQPDPSILAAIAKKGGPAGENAAKMLAALKASHGAAEHPGKGAGKGHAPQGAAEGGDKVHKIKASFDKGAAGKLHGAEGGKGKGAKGGDDGGDDAAAGPPKVVDREVPHLAGDDMKRAYAEAVAGGLRVPNSTGIVSTQLYQGLKAEQLFWTPAGVEGEKPGYFNNATFVPGVHGQGILLRDTVFAAAPEVGQFDRVDPYTIDVWVKLRNGKPYNDTNIFYNAGGRGGSGYEMLLEDNHLVFNITHAAPYNMISVSSLKALPQGKWVHLTTTYDGNSKAGGVHLYVDGQPFQTEVLHDHLTRSAKPRAAFSQFGSYFGLAFGKNFGRLEFKDGAIDELRVFTQALTPLEVSYLQNPASVAAAQPDAARGQMIEAAAVKDPNVVAAWQALRDARMAEQKVETPIYQMMVAGDTIKPRPNYILHGGLYDQHGKEVPTQALPSVFPWSDKLPRNRLGLTQWLFDPKHPLTSRVYVNRMWQSHFGMGIVQTAEDFGAQGSNPSNPQLLDYLAVEFVKSGWDIKHMQKLMVMSATYRQSSALTPDLLEKDSRNVYLARGPRYRMPAEMIRDNALTASGLLVDKVGGDSVFPYQPDAVWDLSGAYGQIYPTSVPADQMHRRTLYTYMKRNAEFPSLTVFDMADRGISSVTRNISNTPLQALVLLNDPQYMEAYRKVAERAMKRSASTDQQLIDIFRLGVRRRPNAVELTELKRYHGAELARLSQNSDEAAKILKIGVSPVDTSLDPNALAAMTMTAANVMNTPDAYTLR